MRKTSPPKKSNRSKTVKATVPATPESPSFHEPSTDENQTNYSLAMETSRKPKTKTTTQTSRGRTKTRSSTRKSSSSISSPDTNPNPKPLSQNKGNKQNVKNIDPKPGTSRGVRQNVENIDPQQGTNRGNRQNLESIDAQLETSHNTRQNTGNTKPQPGTSRGVRQNEGDIIPNRKKGGTLQNTSKNTENVVRNPGTSRDAVVAVNKRKQNFPIKITKSTPCLREIYKLQCSTQSIIPKLPFSRLIREILHSSSTTANRITPPALIALQESSELYLTHLFEDSYRCTLHRSRVTLSVKDMQLVKFIRGLSDPASHF